MDFKNIVSKQLLLDAEIKKVHQQKNENYNNQLLIALFVEVGELANEIQSFKYWKKSKNINNEKLLEEYADCIHFLISFALKYKCKLNIEPKIISQDINVQFLNLFNLINKMSAKQTKCIIEKTIAVYLGIAKLLEISDEQIENAYFLKNQINFERIKNNY